MKLFPLFLLLFTVVLAACGGADTPETPADEPITFTMGDPVADSTVALIVTVGQQVDTLGAEVFFQQYVGQVQRNPYLMADTSQARELRRSIAEGYVFQSVLSGLARRETDLKIDATQADLRIAQIREQAQQAGTTLEAELDRAGMTLDSLRSLYVQELRMRAMAERLAESAAMPSEADVDTYREEQAEEVRLQHIMFIKSPGLSAAQRDSVRMRAAAVLDSAQAGTPFADLARRHSEDGNAANGGDLDYLSRAAGLPTSVEKAAFALRDSGDVAPEVVESPVGYHLLRLTGRRTGTPMDTTQARRVMLNERKGEAVEKAIKEAIETMGVVVRVNPEVVQADLNTPYKEGE